jgi:hypothetical protein
MRAVVALLMVLLAACGGGGQSIGTTYNDPEGTYAIQVDPAWELQVGGVAQGIEVWFLGPAESDFRPNVNVLTQTAPGVSLDQYAQVSVTNAPQFISDFALVAQSQLDGPSGRLGLLEYTGSYQGRQLHFLAYFGVRNDRAVVATLTTPPISFASWRSAIEPYMKTLSPK